MSDPSQPPSAQSKPMLRQAAATVRDKAHRVLGKAAATAFSDHFLSGIQPVPACVIAGYFPIRSEADVVPLLDRLNDLGHTCALPLVLGAHEPLAFHQWRPGASTTSGAYGTRVPLAGAREVVPDIVLVPLLAFDPAGTRLGYGGGFYDRTLAKLREKGSCIAVGVAFSAQQRDLLPCDPYDEALDWVVTEKGCRHFERKPG